MYNPPLATQNQQSKPCSCDSALSYAGCCEPFIAGAIKPTTPLQLMRSRYTAYARGYYQYILDTYSVDTQPNITAAELAHDNEHTLWLHLRVIDSHHDISHGEVEFKAYYKVQRQLYCMHERSQFVCINSQWGYTQGTILQSSGEVVHGRNEVCFCSSGKKFKRCCGK